jgi:hypothetical protein
MISYKFLLGSLRSVMLELAEGRTSQLMARLENGLIAGEEQDSRLITSAVATSLKNLGGDTAQEGERANIETIQLLIYVHANLLAAAGAARRFALVLGKEVERLSPVRK